MRDTDVRIILEWIIKKLDSGSELDLYGSKQGQ
jgi:hypothetical protein